MGVWFIFPYVYIYIYTHKLSRPLQLRLGRLRETRGDECRLPDMGCPQNTFPLKVEVTYTWFKSD